MRQTATSVLNPRNTSRISRTRSMTSGRGDEDDAWRCVHPGTASALAFVTREQSVLFFKYQAESRV